MLTSTQQAVLWIACAGMGVGALAIAGLGLRAPRGQKHHFVMSAAVCVIAFTAYFAMANGYGIVHTGGRLEFYARYIDWFLTTPLLIGGLLMIGLAPKPAGDDGRDRAALVFGAVFADMFMIAAGLAAGLTNTNSVKYGFYAISCIAFLIVLGVLWGPILQAAKAQGGSTYALYRRLTTTLSALWIIYPILWILGTEGTKAFGLTAEIIVFAVIDLSAKVLFGLLLCSGVLQQTSSAATAAGPARTPATAGARA